MARQKRSSEPKAQEPKAQPCRFDRWLWAARFFKTRSLASEAIDGGKAHLNGTRVKRGRAVQLGDEVRVQKGPYTHQGVVRGLSQKRGSATAAAELFEESQASIDARAALAEERRLRAAAMPSLMRGRPTKRDRRQIISFRTGQPISPGKRRKRKSSGQGQTRDP